MHYVNIGQFGDQLKERREPLSVQEEMFVIFNFSLAQTSWTFAVEIMPVSVIAQVTEFNMQLSKKFDSF